MKILASHGWWRQHWLIVTVPAVLSTATAGSLLAYAHHVDTQTATQQQQAAVSFTAYDAKIAALKTARAAKLKADHDAAVATAEASRSATADSSAVIVCHNGLTMHGDPTTVDVIVNKSHCINPIDYAPADLVSVDGYLVSAQIAPHLQDMMAAAAADNVPFGLTSAFRSYANQVTTYNGWAATNGSTAKADTVSARPGYSEHQTGFAVDLNAPGCALECFATTPQYEWLQQHAADYGFVQRYYDGYQSVTGYSPEAWHYRYVGAAIAKEMKAKGIKTLEQYWGVSGGDYAN